MCEYFEQKGCIQCTFLLILTAGVKKGSERSHLCKFENLESRQHLYEHQPVWKYTCSSAWNRESRFVSVRNIIAILLPKSRNQSGTCWFQTIVRDRTCTLWHIQECWIIFILSIDTFLSPFASLYRVQWLDQIFLGFCEYRIKRILQCSEENIEWSLSLWYQGKYKNDNDYIRK